MKTNTLLLAALFATTAYAEPPAIVEDIITRGPRAGQKRIITNTVAFPREATVLQKEAVIALSAQGRRTNVAVELISYRHNVVDQHGPFTRYEFQVRAKGEHGFVWSCWAPDFCQPHRFQVLTTESGKSYACYIREGVHLFQLSESCLPDAMRRGFWENPDFESERPDALPVLQMEQLREALGPECLLHLSATTVHAEVLHLSDREGELRVTVRGREPRPLDYFDDRVPAGAREKWLLSRATFALRHGQWELVSTSGKETGGQ